ncbi:PKD domain-containing protein [Planctomycetota bacterium]
MTAKNLMLLITVLTLCRPVRALQRPEVTFKVFQFPADQIPRVDGEPGDWAMVPENYTIGTDQLWEDSGKHDRADPNTLDVRVRVGWVKGLNRLYFLYEAYDDYWDFSLPGLHNDTFEIVVDGDASGGPLIDKGHRELWTPEHVGQTAAVPDNRISPEEANWAIHGVHAQNYHIFTPAAGKDWTLAWGVQPYIKELPYANAKCSYNFKPGESGKLVLEFWITPFDYAGPEGPQRAVESRLWENKIIGLSWAIIDYDNVNSRSNDGFWNLSRHHRMYGNASLLCAFQLMPLEAQFLRPVDAQWSFKVIDMDRRLVGFKDLSYGKITSWTWDFGDGRSSTEQHPIHAYEKAGQYVVVLDVKGPDGQSRRSKVRYRPDALG